MNISGLIIPRAIQVRIQPTQFIVVPRCKVAGDKNLYSQPFSLSPLHTAPSMQQGEISRKSPKRMPAIIGPFSIKTSFLAMELLYLD